MKHAYHHVNSNFCSNAPQIEGNNSDSGKGCALVFGASGEQGWAVVEGLLEHGGYSPVYAITTETSDVYWTDGLNVTLLTGDIKNPNNVHKALINSKAQAIF